MRNTQYLVAVALLSASVLAGGSPEQPANKNTPARAQREQDADARVHKTPAQVEGALKATVARGEHDDAAANFAEAHARAGGAAARALEAPANAAQVTNPPKLGALAADRRQLSSSSSWSEVGLYSTQTEAESSTNDYNTFKLFSSIDRVRGRRRWRRTGGRVQQWVGAGEGGVVAAGLNYRGSPAGAASSVSGFGRRTGPRIAP